MAIRTAPVSENSFAIRTAMLTHMRSEAMFNLFVRRCTTYGDGFKVYSYHIRMVFVRGPYELPIYWRVTGNTALQEGKEF